jgi:hypothetical protein
VTGVLTPSWANPFVKPPGRLGFRGYGDSVFGDLNPSTDPRHNMPRVSRKSQVRRRGEGPFFTLRSILGAWALMISYPDPATEKLARANREIPVRVPLLPPQFDLRSRPRYAWPAVLPIRGIAA